MLHCDFLLTTDTAKGLYAEIKDLPIIDYHNHLSAKDIAENKRFLDVYELWIAPDPYKHRAMRMCGVPEEYITGGAAKEEKFAAWCQTLPKLQLNPLSHWSYMELEKIFGWTARVHADNAKELYAYCNDYLQKNELTVAKMMDIFGVEYACPCASLAEDTSVFDGDRRFAPSLRGDDIVAPTKAFIEKLESAAGVKIDTLDGFKRAICLRLDVYAACGCRFSDHALDNGFVFYKDDGKNAERFHAALDGELSCEEKAKLTSYLLVFLGEEYAKRNFVMQLHIGAERYTSSTLRQKVGPAGGFAGIGNCVDVRSLTEFLDAVDKTACGLPKTVLFTLNPADNAVMSVLSGSYAKDGVAGLITQGPAWWWCDHKQGIVEMFENAAVFSAFSNFVGMTTDSRSFLSFVRHEYFRRVLCDWLGKKWEQGELLCSKEDLKTLLQKLCYQNAKNAVQ
ncbi:MAG: glucuronate isomerase [Clostridia bacterium]|nr:glucuronate isomerase [Clostridia bacterium]